MSPVRFAIVNAVIAGYLLFTLALFVTRKEVWPFCIYWMYESTLHRGDSRWKAIDFYSVADGKETWIPYQGRHVLAWGYDLGIAPIKLGWSSPGTRQFLLAALEELRREAKEDAQPEPSALRVYREVLVFPASGDLRPVVTDRRLLLQVREGES